MICDTQPTSIVRYNHLRNYDGVNLSALKSTKAMSLSSVNTSIMYVVIIKLISG